MPQPPKPKNPLVLVVIILAGLLVAGIVAAIIYFATDKETETVEQLNIDTTTVVIPTETTTDTVIAQPAPEPEKPAHPKVSSPYDYVVNGSVGKYGIVMEISFNGDGSISGRYRYTRMKGAGGWLTLYGYHSRGSFEMFETDNNDNVTGTFSGNYSTDGDAVTLSGSMINAKGRSYNFNANGYESL